MEITSRGDWLVDGLSALPNAFVSASPHWSQEHAYRYPVTARLVGHGLRLTSRDRVRELSDRI